MNNSDIIAALSLFLTGAIFLAQTNGDLIRLKFQIWEIRLATVILTSLIVLANSAMYERWGVNPYFSIGRFYLTPSEWALILFLILFGLITSRVFADKIFRQDYQLIFKLLHKYKAESEYAKCWNLIEQTLQLSKSSEHFQQLDLEFFSDPVFIQKTASEKPYLLTSYCQQNRYSSLNSGENLYYVLSGLFSSNSNPVFSEMDTYRFNEKKGNILDELMHVKIDDIADYEKNSKFLSAFPIIDWFVGVINEMPFSLQDDTLHFLKSAGKEQTSRNAIVYSSEEVHIILKRDSIFNALQFFRIGLMEHVFNYKKGDQMIDRVLPVFYSSWDFLLSRTNLEIQGVQLNNGAYTVNEYLCRYQFESYIFLIMGQSKIHEIKRGENINEWTLKQLFSKIDSLIGSNKHVNMNSKRYYIEELFDLFFKTDQYISYPEGAEQIKKLVLIFIKSSLEKSPYGAHALIEEAYNKAFDRYDFVPFERDEDLVQHFYVELLPYTKDHEYKITGTVQ